MGLISKRKIAVILAVILIIMAFPVGLVLREIYGFSDTMGTALPSFLLGAGVGILLISVLIPGGKKKVDKTADVISDDNNTTETPTSEEV